MVQYSKFITTMDGLNPQTPPKLYAITHLDLFSTYELLTCAVVGLGLTVESVSTREEKLLASWCWFSVADSDAAALIGRTGVLLSFGESSTFSAIVLVVIVLSNVLVLKSELDTKEQSVVTLEKKVAAVVL